MADQVITKQELIDAQKDAQTLEDAVNGEPGKLIKSRTGREFYSLASVPQINTMTREEVTAAVAPKANDAEVYKKTETFTKQETNALVAPKANQTDVDSAISGMNLTLNTSLANLSTDANKFYPTLVEANAAIASIVVNQPVTIGEVTNSGLWYKATADATTLTKSPYDPLTQAKNYIDSFATVKAKDIASDNLDNLTTEGDYYKAYGSAIPDDFASLNYPVKSAGMLHVTSNKQTGANLQIKQTYTVFPGDSVYSRQKIGLAAWTAWVIAPKTSDIAPIMAALSNVHASGLTWQKSSLSNAVSYDPVTKMVSIRGNVLTGFESIASTRRIQILATPEAPLTFQIINNFDVIWLDLSAIPADGNINLSNYASILKIGSYASAAASRYTSKSTQVPLMKYDYLNNRVNPAEGFVDITNVSTTPTDLDESKYFDYDKTANRLNVYFPCSSGEFIRVGLTHQITAAENTASVGSNSDLWRIYTANICDANFNVGTQIVNEGEWECAIYHTNNTQAEGVTKDFVGGYHGDEVLSDVYMLVNGVRKSQDFTVSGKAKAQEITLVQKSTIYFQGTLTPLAEHLKVISFTVDGISVKQQVKMLSEVEVDPFYMCMLPIMRIVDGVQVTDYSSRSDDYFIAVDDNTTGGLPKRYSLVDKPLAIKQWGQTTGYASETTIHKMTQLVNLNNVYIALNSTGAAYNKIYASPCNVNSPYTIAENTVLESDVFHKFDKT